MCQVSALTQTIMSGLIVFTSRESFGIMYRNQVKKVLSDPGSWTTVEDW